MDDEDKPHYPDISLPKSTIDDETNFFSFEFHHEIRLNFKNSLSSQVIQSLAVGQAREKDIKLITYTPDIYTKPYDM